MPRYKLTIDLATNKITHFTIDLTQAPQTEAHLVQAIFEGDLPATMTLLNCTDFKYVDRLIVSADADLPTSTQDLDASDSANTTVLNFAVFTKDTKSLLRMGRCAPELLSTQAALTGDEDMLIMTNPDGSPLTAFVKNHQGYLNFETREYFQIGLPPTPEHRYGHLQRTWVLPDTP
jgi:hypothetical protein